MTRSTRRAGLLGGMAVAAMCTTATAHAEEAPSAHAAAAEKTVHLGSTVVTPSALDLDKDETVAFENYALYPLSVTFIEPAQGQAERIRCELIAPKAGQKAKAPWGLFTWNGRKQLVGNIPPGRFASLCSLAPGDYAYVVNRVGGAAPGGVNTATQKGTIRVK